MEGAQIGKYLLGRKLGQGGFGVVYRARDGSLDREVALKFLHAEHTSTPQMLQRFLQEARSAAAIAHPGIVTVFECGHVDDAASPAHRSAYIAMELLAGESLTDRLARSGRLPAEQAIEIGRQLASALEAAHRRGIVHRDLKPDNVFLVQDAAVHGGERVKVLDFGIAKLGRSPDSVQTQSMMVFGTPRYMSPEQCRSATHVDARSDIYTLGCILFELVTGRAPFAGQPGELIAQHLLVPAPPVGDVPGPLAELIARMLAKDPEARPPSMAGVQRELEAIGEPSRAYAPGIAPTLPPDAFVPRGSPDPTTLGGATGAVVELPARRQRWLAGVAVAAILAILATAFIARGGESPVHVSPAVAPPSSNPTPTPPPDAQLVDAPREIEMPPEQARPEPVKPSPPVVRPPPPRRAVVERVPTPPTSPPPPPAESVRDPAQSGSAANRDTTINPFAKP
jgi:serine/threonine-protein kinase